MHGGHASHHSRSREQERQTKDEEGPQRGFSGQEYYSGGVREEIGQEKNGDSEPCRGGAEEIGVAVVGRSVGKGEGSVSWGRRHRGTWRLGRARRGLGEDRRTFES